MGSGQGHARAAFLEPCARVSDRPLRQDGFTSGDTLHGSSRVISIGLRNRIGDTVEFDEARLAFFKP
jgi:hypothetical protein